MKKRAFPHIQEAEIKKGTILYVPLGTDEGLIVTGGYKYRNKFVVIVGTTVDGFVIGSLLINTNAHDNTPELGACQFPLEQKDYPKILDYKSWLDCSQLFRVTKSKILAQGEYCGCISERDWGFLQPFLCGTDMLSKREKKEFGIISE